MDPTSIALAISASLLPKLVQYIGQEIADNQKSEHEATRAALQRLADEHELEPVLPKVDAMIADAHRPEADRTLHAVPPDPISHLPTLP